MIEATSDTGTNEGERSAGGKVQRGYPEALITFFATATVENDNFDRINDKRGSNVPVKTGDLLAVAL